MDRQRFKDLLEGQHSWPCQYTFKFIVPRDDLPAVLGLLPGVTPLLRSSAKNNYVSVTFKAHMATSDEVIDVYDRASLIKSIISL